jgi:hypothetical protein
MRYVIKHPDGTYFTEMRSVETKAVTLRGQVIGHEETYRPKFDAPQPRFASQFDTEADAAALLHDSQFGAPDSFAGCSIYPSE